MKMERKLLWMGGVWVVAVMVVGGMLTSFHQIFVTPDAAVLRLVKVSNERWNVVHVLSGSCGCSQRVMQHLLERPRGEGVTEQVLVVDGDDGVLAETPGLLARVEAAGFGVTHVASATIAEATRLRGVPLLLVADSEGRMVYAGGYGVEADSGAKIFQQVLAGETVTPYPIVGCAVGRHLQRRADPLRLKY